MSGATVTSNGPVVAPEGMVAVMEVLLHELIVRAVPLSVAVLLPCDTPKFDPKITTLEPTVPVVLERLAITGAGTEGVLIDTLSNVTVASVEVLRLVAAKPIYTFCAIVMV